MEAGLQDENNSSDVTLYEGQLQQVELSLAAASEESEREQLLSLKNDLCQLIALTKTSPENTNVDDEFTLFMQEINNPSDESESQHNLQNLQGTKCRAPHKHQWGETVYHNALISSVTPTNDQVKVFFTHPTHREMLPCPYYLETECKFTDDRCHFSHGELVDASDLRDYVEPNFDGLRVGSAVLVRQPSKLWHRAKVKGLYDDKCVVSMDSGAAKDVETDLGEILPLDFCCESDDEDEVNVEDVINTTLLDCERQSDGALGEWEKFTKGIGSKLMQKMGYITGSGLGRRSDGRINPVTAVALPAGKSLDYCMNLRENRGNDKDLFSVERRLKHLQRKQELKNQQIYEREAQKTDVFDLINQITKKPSDERSEKRQHRLEIKKESARSLNVAALKLDEDIRRTESDIFKLKSSLKRHDDCKSELNRSLRGKLTVKESELRELKVRAGNVRSEQELRSNKKKMTVF